MRPFYDSREPWSITLLPSVPIVVRCSKDVADPPHLQAQMPARIVSIHINPVLVVVASRPLSVSTGQCAAPVPAARSEAVLHHPPPAPLPVVICIPARREASCLPALFGALEALDDRGAPLTVCVYLDGDDDGSAAWLRDQRRGARLTIDVAVGVASREPSAGRARRAALAMAERHLHGGDGLLFTTDADSRPRGDWIVAGAAALAAADVVAGRIVRDGGAGDAMQTRVERYYDRLHAYRRVIDPVPWEAAATHHFGGGANLAIRAAAYRAVGGFAPLPFAEDARLLDDAARLGLRVRRDAALVVATSSRRDGRAAHGLASALRAHDDGAPPLVAHPDGAAWQWRAQAAARAAFAAIRDTGVRRPLAVRLGLSSDHVLGVARDCPNAEAFAMRVVPAATGMPNAVTLDDAERALARLEDRSCEVAA